jgi:septation ring formation regulator EzrA
MSVPEAAIPVLHLSLRETRRELQEMRELAEALAHALDHEVDARHGVRTLNARLTNDALYRAREAGLL